MTKVRTITRQRRTYNQWVANETLEDFALRFTARRARRWTPLRVANTALGSISFLALEAIGAAITLSTGFDNAVVAIMIVGAILFLTGLPIAYHAAKAGVDIDLLTRGAGFGYIGSTITSLIYASFTFIFFALEAAILAMALDLCFGVPLWIGYPLNALVVIPLVTHGFTKISIFQKWTQAPWIALNILPFLCVLYAGNVSFDEWIGFTPEGRPEGLDLLMLGAACGVVLSLIAQIGEQVDFLRFLPEPTTRAERRRWWLALIAAGPGWSALGVLKMLAGSYLAVLALSGGASYAAAADPTHMYLAAFSTAIADPRIALILAGTFVVIAQLKINVTNAYAGSIAWSNFFARLTHAHPGRVVWLVFNVTIALMLMELGVFAALEATLTIYATVAVAWVGAIVADLTVNKPLGLSPEGIEFRRGYLYDINPVGVGAMAGGVALGFCAHGGLLGVTAAALGTPIALVAAFALAPLIAWATDGRYYIARPHEPAHVHDAAHGGEAECTVCGNAFESDDTLYCPFYTGPICSLCCSLDARCGDVCRPHAQLREQAGHFVDVVFPPRIGRLLKTRYAAFAALMTLAALVMGIPLRYVAVVANDPAALTTPTQAVWLSFAILAFVAGIAIWLFVLAQEASRTAMRESDEHAQLLMREIRAHKRTDAQLRRARQEAEAANGAKSRYVVGITHELRTPLNAILGYAQLLEADPDLPPRRREAVSVMRRSGEHLSGLIEGLLDISKIEAGRLELHPGTVNLPEFLDQLVAIFRMQAADRGLAFKFVIEDKIPDWVRCDEHRLKQILMNLLTNAIRYTERGEVEFKVGYRSEVARFTVSDTGIGIDPSEIQKIFMPFARLSRPGGPVVPGTGLGLTITKLLTEIQGGELKVASIPGVGSRFSVRLMLPRVHQTTSVPVKHIRVVTGYLGPGRTIMVVEDEPDHRRLLEDVLRPIGFNLFLAAAAEEALDLLGQVRPDLFLIDVKLPGLSGWDLAERIRAVGSDAPIVMVSAHASDRLAEEERAGLTDEFIAKPINVEDLLVRLERQLGLTYTVAGAGLAPGVAAPRPRLSRERIAELRRFAQIGWPRGLTETLAAIEEEDPDLSGTVAHLKGIVATFDMSRLDTVLTEMEAADER
ncbi:hybrid sensor histidine kinase/response regulator [Acuticoccus sediminis]|uniref:histidine kinase n=1 Tax=Acuticoccus sediminis TaxID=2184697 RepID=A0A8B2NX86_9HYPH|nr:hybrid sensor histidine kinase/response regulator [Acuticoccus sediminis]RAI01962.1 hybrid sensor histidine kinase/response regulator [Acuticoccus sediminis]